MNNLMYFCGKYNLFAKLLSLLTIVWIILIGCSTVKAEEPFYDVGFIMLNIKNISMDPFFEVRIDQEQNIYMPISKILEYLELYLFEINWQGEFITGLIPSTDEYCYFDLKTGQMKRDDQVYHVQKDHYFIENEELYIYYKEYGNWLPILISWDDWEFEMLIDTQFKLFSEILAEREEVREKYFQQRQTVIKDVRKIKPSIFSKGLFSYQTNVKGSLDGIGTSGLSLQYGGQLLYGDFSTGMNITPDGEIKLSLFQLEYHDLPVFTEVKVGSSFLEFSPILRGAGNVQGISLSNQDAKFKFGLTTLNGYVPEGSEVELYERGALVDFQKADDGFYSFQNIDVQGAFNSFDIIIYTPKGRILRKKAVVLSRDQQLNPKKFIFKCGFGNGKDGLMGSLKGYYGINQRLTLGSTLSYFNSEDELKGKEKYLGGEIFFKLHPSTYLYLDTNFDLSGGGFGYLSEIQSIIKSITLRLGILGYVGIYPPNRGTIIIDGSNCPLSYKGLFEFSKNGTRQSISANYQLDNFNGNLYHLFDSRFSYRLSLKSDFQVRNILKFGAGQNLRDQLMGGFSFKGLPFVDLMANFKCTIQKEGLKEPGLNIDIINKQNSRSKLSYNASISLGNNKVKLSAGAQYPISDSLMLTGSISKDSINLSLNLQELRRLKWPFKKAKGGSISKGWVEGIVYLDSNGNRRWDEEEITFENVNILINDRPKGATDESGRYAINGLTPRQPIGIRVDGTSLDALYTPADDKVWIEIRPSTGMKVDLGVVPCSGISGYLCGDEALLRDISGEVAVIMKNEKGEEVYRTYSECDGIYVFEKILPGKYYLTLSFPEGMEKKKFEPEGYEVVMPGGEIPEWFDGMDFNFD